MTTWKVGEIVMMKETDDRKGEIVGFPKIHNAAMSWVVWSGNERKMSVPIDPLVKFDDPCVDK